MPTTVTVARILIARGLHTEDVVITTAVILSSPKANQSMAFIDNCQCWVFRALSQYARERGYEWIMGDPRTK